MARPLSGSISSVKPVAGTPSGGPDSAREFISSADLRRVSASAPSQCATRAYMRSLLPVACEEPTLTGADRSGQAVDDGVTRGPASGAVPLAEVSGRRASEVAPVGS